MNPTAINAAARLFENGAVGHTAIECGARQISYGELRDSVARAGGAWRALGLGGDERVAVFAPDSIDWVTAYLGAIWAGGVAIGINPRLSMEDLAPILVESEVRFVWTTAELAPQVAALAQTLARPPLVIAATGVPALHGSRDWGAACAAATAMAPVPRAADDMALWIGTSGTTGTPKGVIHTQGVTAACGEFARQVLGAGSHDRFYASSKLFFAYALANSLFAGLRLGATVILDDEWPTAQRVAEMVKAHRPSIVFSVPTLYHKMLQGDVADVLSTCGIRRFVSAGEALPATLRAAWRERTGAAPVSGYGTSETLALMLYNDDDSGLLRPTPLTEIAYGELADDIPQRVWFRHPAIARGYWQRPQENAEDFQAGRFSPGDMFLRHAGQLEFTGRNDDMLKIAGQWVSTQWVERTLRAACGDAVQDVAAVGVKSADDLTAISAFVVATPTREREAQQRLQEVLAELSGHKRPRWIHWVEALPQTATGKLQRSRLGALHREFDASQEQAGAR